jgi:hypothetical protein
MMRKPKTLGWAGALLLGLSLAAGYAAADTSADKKEPAKAGKGRAGAACKTDADCDQSGQPMTCRASKCQIDRIPPPT